MKGREDRSKEDHMKSILAKMLNLTISEVDDLVKEEKKEFQSRKNCKSNTGYAGSRGKNACEKYMATLRNIDSQSFGLGRNIKKLKKVITQSLQNCGQLKIHYSTSYPMLIFSYYEDRRRQSYRYKHLREVMKEVPSLKRKVMLFDDIFGRVYERVDCKYFCLVVFALEKAEQVRVKVTEKDLLTYSEQNTVMFYFQKGQNQQLNFIIFDKFLRSIEFHSLYIQQHQKQYPAEYAKFQELHDTVFNEKTPEESNDIFNREEVESDEEERPPPQTKPLGKLQSEVQRLLDKDLSDLQQKIQDLVEEVEAESLRDSASDVMLRLTQKIEELEENKTNYEQVRNKVKMDLKKGNRDSYAIGLKKLLIAEKQLESKLPIIAKKRKIFEMLKKQNLLIIEGETGSGKSTQFPQMLCEYYELFDNPSAKPVLVTQPRRLATRSLAERVAIEMGENVGGFVDYMASAGKRVNPKAKIVFKLDRLVLDELTEDPILSNYSCLVIDEAHERTISIDVILGLIKQLLSKRTDFKIIVTSASMDVQLFQNYFKTKTLKVSGRMFPVTVAYKDYSDFRQGDRLQMVRKIERVINEQILHNNDSMKIQFKGHLLCFCSGVQQITELVKIYQKKLNPRSFTVLPLHGKISPADQRKVFQMTGKHKFIFASRIAETAITIDGVRVVIDPGQDIQLVYDQRYKISTMKMMEISQSSAKQRAGRSGRTAPGFCFRLYSESDFKKRQVCKVPQMQNSSLETVVLRLKSLKINEVITFPYLSKPSIEGLKNSQELLKLIGALEGTSGKITKIGELLVKIPVDPFLSRAIVEGMIFQKIFRTQKYAKMISHLPEKEITELDKRGLVQTITVLLSLLINFSNLFFIKPAEREKGESVKYKEFSDEEGDFFFLDNIYRKYLELRSEGKQQNFFFKTAKTNALKDWVKTNFLNFKALNQTEELVDEIRKILFTSKIDENLLGSEVTRACLKIQKCRNFREMILSCLITSFSPNLCKYSGNPHIGYTLVNQRRPVQIYGTSNLSLLGIQSDWIICYDLFSNEVGRLYCKVAHQVSFDFIKRHTDSFIQERFSIQKIQDKNPFYSQLHYSVPTTIVRQIKSDFSKGQKDQQLSFLQSTYPIINEQKNEVTFFVLVEEEANTNLIKSQDSANQLLSKLKNYMEVKEREVREPFRHNYIGNFFIYIRDGFLVTNFEFDRKDYTIEMVSIDIMIDYIIQQCKDVGKNLVYGVDPKDKVLKAFEGYKHSKSFKKAIFFINNDLDKNKLVETVERIKKINQGIPVEINIRLVDYRKKVPKTKVFLHFFAGTVSSKNILFMSYESVGSNNPARQMLDILRPAVEKLKLSSIVSKREAVDLIEKTEKFNILPYKLKVSKRQNGINLFDSSCDEFEMHEYLSSLIKHNLVDFRFKFPQFITKFRDASPSEASKTDRIWKEQITQLLEAVGIPTKDIVINIKGYYQSPKDKKMGKFQQTFRVNMNAQLLGFDHYFLNTLKKKIDGENQLLGCQKVHVRAYYQQVMAIPTRKLFDGLEEEFDHQVMLFKEEYPTLFFDKIPMRFKNAERIMVKGRSSNKQDFIKPQRIFSSLYAPKMIKLQPHEFTFLERTDQGLALLDDLEFEFKYKVYFGFERYERQLKVYCDDAEIKGIQEKIKRGIQLFKCYSEKISYRGKNLNTVINILEAAQQDPKTGSNLAYRILFQTREVEVTATLNVFEKVKNSLFVLSNCEKGECQICADVLRSPYKFINCSCVFCWHCVAEYTRNFSTSPELILCCPSEKCLEKKVPINVNDFKTLLPEQQFNKLCDLKFKRFMEKNPNYKSCALCKFCQNILDLSDPNNETVLNCDVCDRVWCPKCAREVHFGYTCQQWLAKIQIGDEQLKKLGIKQCPKCKSGIQKNKGCRHMTCASCGAHICWICLKLFRTEGQCHDHLAKDEGGIFDHQS